MMITKWSNMVTRFLFLPATWHNPVDDDGNKHPTFYIRHPSEWEKLLGGETLWKMLSQKNLKMFATIKFWQDKFLLRLTTLGSVNPLQLDPYFLLLKNPDFTTKKKLNVPKLLGFELFIKINSWRSWVLQ